MPPSLLDDQLSTGQSRVASQSCVPSVDSPSITIHWRGGCVWNRTDAKVDLSPHKSLRQTVTIEMRGTGGFKEQPWAWRAANQHRTGSIGGPEHPNYALRGCMEA
jgi:hypothetical protein